MTITLFEIIILMDIIMEVFNLKKEVKDLRNSVQPRPDILVSCRHNGEDNALAVAVAMNCSFDPPMVAVGIVPSRYSYNMIKESGVFVVNLVTESMREQYAYLGSKSRRDFDKLKELGMETVDGTVVDAPLLVDCPVNAECTIVDSIETGSHVLFIGKVECIHADEELLNENGGVDYKKIDLLKFI
ncbi:NADH-FMN oxidoreductase RutF, flavin reductase (DIM6/NTAB) family [Dethiosulfatibacter aminovorans DSM 17477]|uniref:NADH-FMN oxidoreductase RutF, flavin reductase (DIM6/NTAB) family n=1 Tax=Dethiosulfatibacter aminovorans DSM 17477 TaxID=1121476 RepID=A0A1M6K4Q3_9FIRM|nr:NADH-FMN oxidoreductase RutF, flavin reductase (DIM6/NTAB) family [Dethiosulfatibacter aminovorans DSM 17477]